METFSKASFITISHGVHCALLMLMLVLMSDFSCFDLIRMRQTALFSSYSPTLFFILKLKPETTELFPTAFAKGCLRSYTRTDDEKNNFAFNFVLTKIVCNFFSHPKCSIMPCLLSMFSAFFTVQINFS